MAKYLLRGSYTSEAWAAQVKDPKNRIEAVRPVFDQLGGSIESAYFAFGDDFKKNDRVRKLSSLPEKVK